MIWPFSRFTAKRSQTWKLSTLQSWSDLGGSGPTAAGITVTPEKALSVPAVYACASVLSQDVARCPLRLRRRIGPDTFEDASDHPLWEVIHDLANPETTAYTFKAQMMLDLLTHERAYAEIVRVDGQVVALWRLDPTAVYVDRDEQRRKRYRVTLADGRQQSWTFDASRPPVVELTHPSPIHRCRELIGTALALQLYIGRFFGGNARPAGVLQTDGVLDPEAIANLRESWYQRHGGENVNSVAVLEQGLKWQSIAPPNSDAQLNETAITLSTQIAGAFRVPAFKIGDLTKATYSNMESGENAYVTGTLDPYFTAWEHAIRRDLLTTRQFGAFDVSFDRSTLIRNDIKALHEALARSRDAGIYTANDIRRKLGENPIPADQGGDVLLVNGNMRPIAEAGQQQTEGA